MVSVAALVFTLSDCPRAPQAVHAQNTPIFQQSFSLNTSQSLATIIPPCLGALPTKSAPCISNQGQIGHSITFQWSGLGGSLQGASCGFLLEGSNDNSIWVTLTASSTDSASVFSSTLYSGMVYANGYYNFLRIRIIACPGIGGTTPVPLTGVYTGYSSTLPVTLIADQRNQYYENISSVVGISYGNLASIPFLTLGFQCFNSDTTLSFLLLYSGSGAPTLGASGWVYQIGIPAGATFNYSGPPMMFGQQFKMWIDTNKTIDAGGTRPTKPIICTFQTSTQGPFYPQTPVQP